MEIVDPRVDPTLVPAGSKAIVIAEHQSEYRALPSIRTPDGMVITRWSLTDEERRAILLGEDLYVTHPEPGRDQPAVLHGRPGRLDEAGMKGVLAAQWESLRASVLPAAALPIQLEECRRAFYAGCAAMRVEILHAIDGEDEPATMAQLDALDAEIQAFATRLRRMPDPGPASDPPNTVAVGELVALGQWMDVNLEMGADQSQVADPAILARRDIHNHIVARIAELKGVA